jgi:predicted PhzF superfamily epimerase YddE/YHI9
MTLSLYQVDAFTSQVFRGNPAAVVPLERWLDDATLQRIAAENNLSETAYLVREPEGFRIRWFTPKVEVALCGHATLASAWVLFSKLEPGRDSVTFASKSGPLVVTREGGRLVLDFPARPGIPWEAPPALVAALGAAPRASLKAMDVLLVYDEETQVRALRPDFGALAELDTRGVIVTARGQDVDFVSRFFAPRVGVPEDPVTGSAHCTLVPYWAARLGKNTLHARQVSERGGELWCELRGDRVRIAGQAALYLTGTIEID